jgi:carbonic anhydrase
MTHERDIERAAATRRSGDLVAFLTKPVVGLEADAKNAATVRRTFRGGVADPSANRFGRVVTTEGIAPKPRTRSSSPVPTPRRHDDSFRLCKPSTFVDAESPLPRCRPRGASALPLPTRLRCATRPRAECDLAAEGASARGNVDQERQPMMKQDRKRTAPMAMTGLACVMLVAATGCRTGQEATIPAPPSASSTLTQAEQQAMTPRDVLKVLKAGNERFARGQSTTRDYLAQARATAPGQYPMAVVLSCLDSRIPVELVLDRGIGDLFVARVAGNFENTDILGSMEFATKLAGARLIVVLGHTNCGAIKGACDGAQMGHLTSTLANIAPAVEASRSIEGEGDRDSHDAAFVAAVSHANIRQTMADIVGRSPVLADLVDAGQLAIAGGMYDLDTGTISWIEN